MDVMRAGNQVSEAKAAVDCAARVFVDVYSKAAAEAAVNADCVSFSDTAIYANVATAVSAEVTWTEFCDASDAVRGSADVETYGDSYADAVRSPHPLQALPPVKALEALLHVWHSTTRHTSAHLLGCCTTVRVRDCAAMSTGARTTLMSGIGRVVMMRPRCMLPLFEQRILASGHLCLCACASSASCCPSAVAPWPCGGPVLRGPC